MRRRTSWVLLLFVPALVLLPLPGCTLDDYVLVNSHQVPEWFQDAKFGVLVHYGPYNVPGWAPLEEPGDFFQPDFFKHHPYAEWYWNSMKIEGSPTQQYHRETYGEGFSYYDFGPLFNDDAREADLEEWADIFQDAGVKYVVLTGKHHDGYCLWPTEHENPLRPGWHCERDVVGDLCAAVRARGMRMGLYYSPGLDWTFTEDRAITGVLDLMSHIPQTPEFTRYVEDHLRELIERYRPDVLWGDIGIPSALDRWALWADYYRVVPDGAINDRWMQNPLEQLYSMSIWDGSDEVPPFVHFDFFTPEYRVMDGIRKLKWETCRGIGWSFAYNRQEEENTGHLLSAEELVESLVDVVSKNGNLLLGIGPRSDGTIPETQLEVLRGMGDWLRVNGDAIYGTRPWVRAEGSADGGAVRVRFTQRGDAGSLFAVLLDRPAGRKVTLQGLKAGVSTTVRLLGNDRPLSWRQRGSDLVITLPQGMPEAAAYTLELSPIPATS
ncbi:MAG: alpha-L-fucosidase [Actinobacteria bacterium]|nr:alpha-L-fucosidase [Actinomycetota bacterium]